MIGASGAIAGVLGGYLLLHPKANVNVLMWIIIFISVIRIPAFIVLGFWIIGQFFNASFGASGSVISSTCIEVSLLYAKGASSL